MSQTLSWFDSTNADDRFLATALEIIRANMGAIVFIVTSDINMQNKAEMAGIPFREVPAQSVEQKEG
jgi:predicted ribonuclease YlaK